MAAEVACDFISEWHYKQLNLRTSVEDSTFDFISE